MKNILTLLFIITSFISFSQINVASRTFDIDNDYEDGCGNWHNGVVWVYDDNKEIGNLDFSMLFRNTYCRTRQSIVTFPTKFNVDSIVVTYVNTGFWRAPFTTSIGIMAQTTKPYREEIESFSNILVDSTAPRNSNPYYYTKDFTLIPSSPLYTNSLSIFFASVNFATSDARIVEIEVFSSDPVVLGTYDIVEKTKEVVKTYNTQGHVIPNDTKNHLIIREYSDGTREKIFVR